jgi:uncharacterized protein
MTNEERQIIADFIARVAGASAPQQQTPWGGASVPATTTSALPPIDREADTFIADQFNRYPEARYRLTQLAFVQEHALVEAQNRMKRLEWELQQAQQAAQQQQHGGGGLFSGLFGGGRSQTPPPGGTPAWGQAGQPPPNYQPGSAPPQYPPNYNPGMFQRQGSGFLGSALTTAAGVAGGVLAADAIRDLFSPHQGLAGGFGPGSETGSPWGAPPVDQGVPPDQGYVDQGTWDQSTDQGTWNDPSGGADQDSSWDQGGGGNWDDQSSGGSDDDSLI